MWSRIYLTPMLMAEGDRDAYRREQAALAREKEIMKDVKGWEVCIFSCFPCLLYPDMFSTFRLAKAHITATGHQTRRLLCYNYSVNRFRLPIYYHCLPRLQRYWVTQVWSTFLPTCYSLALIIRHMISTHRIILCSVVLDAVYYRTNYPVHCIHAGMVASSDFCSYTLSFVKIESVLGSQSPATLMFQITRISR